MITISFSIPDWLILLFVILGFIKVGVDIWAMILRKNVRKKLKNWEANHEN